MVWTYGYAAMAALVLVGMAAAFMAKEPRAKEREAEAEALGERTGNPLNRFFRAAYDAFADFLSKKDALLILLFVILYKLTDTFAGVMTGPFVLDIGFDKASYAAIIKGVGLIAALAGGVAGGVLARAMPLSRALLVAGILQAVANFTFSWQAWIGVNHAALALAISTENFTSAIGTVVFIAYLSALCTSPAHTATQFALLTAVASFGRTTLASITGFVAAATGWVVFFALCAAAAIPGLLILWILIKRGNFEDIERKGARRSRRVLRRASTARLRMTDYRISVSALIPPAVAIAAGIIAVGRRPAAAAVATDIDVDAGAPPAAPAVTAPAAIAVPATVAVPAAMPTATAAPSVTAAPMAAAAMPVAAAVPSAATAMAVSCRGKIGREGDERQRERRYENRHELLHLERPLERGRSV